MEFPSSQSTAPQCDFCPAINVDSHIATHHPRTVDVATTDRSIQTATRQPNGSYLCGVCRAILPNQQDARAHLISHGEPRSSSQLSQLVPTILWASQRLVRRWSQRPPSPDVSPDPKRHKPVASPTPNPPPDVNESEDDGQSSDVPSTEVPSAIQRQDLPDHQSYPKAPHSALSDAEVAPPDQLPGPDVIDETASDPLPRGRPRRRYEAFTLDSISVFVHKATGVTICTVCCNAVLPKNLHGHLNNVRSKCHRSQLIDAEQLNDKLKAAGALDEVDFPAGTVIPQIPTVKVAKGLRCDYPGCCLPPFASENAYKTHCRESHPRTTNARKTELDCHVLYGTNTPHVVVQFKATVPAPEVDGSGRWIQVKSHFIPPPETVTHSASLAYAEQTPLERVLGWHRSLVRCDLQELRNTVSPLEQPEGLSRLETAVRGAAIHYMSKDASPLLTRANPILLALLSDVDPQGDGPRPHRFGPLANETSVRNYSQSFGQLLLFLCNISAHPVPGFTVNFTPGQLASLKALRDICDSPSSTMAERCKAVKESFWEVMTNMPPSSTHTPDELPLIAFFIARHANATEGDPFSSADSINHSMVAIQWCWRATCYLHCVREASENPEDSPIALFNREVQQYAIEGKHTPFACLRSAIRLASHLVHDQQNVAQFTMNYDRTAFTFQGTPIVLEDYKQFVRDLVSNAEHRASKLLLGANVDAIESAIKAALSVSSSAGWFRDVPRESTPGYSFLSAKPSPLTQYNDVLISHMLRKDCTTYAANAPDSAAGEIFNSVNCRAWLSQLDGLVEQLYAATVFTWPGAARGSEIEHLQYVNRHSRRNVYFVNGLLTFVSDYNKTTAINGTSTLIPRAVPPRLARIYILLFAVLYPTASYLCTALGMVPRAQLYQRYVFVRGARTLDPIAMSDILQDRTWLGLQCSMGLRHTRQLIIFILKNAIRIVLEEGKEGAALDILHDLCGHSARTAESHYAIDSNTIHEVTTDQLQQSHRLALAHQEYFGLGYADLRSPSVDEKPARASPSVSAVAGTVTRTDVESAVLSSLSSLLPRITDALSTTVSQHLSYHHPKSGNPSYSVWHPPSESVVVHPSLLSIIKRLWGNARPAFTSPEQATALELIRQGRCNVVCILPTGGGKSLMLYGPALFDDRGVTVVISPLVSLCHQQLQAATEHGITCAMWPNLPSDAFLLRLLIVPGHSLSDPHLTAWMFATLKSDLLRRIVIDEAHELLVSDTYRTCFNRVFKLKDLGVPIHFLTATLLRRSLAALIEKVGLDPSTVRLVAARTARPNLKYEIHDFRPGRAHGTGLMYDVLCQRFSEAQKTLLPHERILVYCSDYEECNMLGKLLKIPCYKAKDDTMAPAEWNRMKGAIQDQWFAGKPSSLIATTAFSLGIDHPHVRYTFVLNPYDLISLVQMTGRGGRAKNSRATCIIMVDKLPPTPPSDGDHGGRLLLPELYDGRTCTRITLGCFDEQAYSCHALPDAELCSYCEKLTPESVIVPALYPVAPLHKDHLHQAERIPSFLRPKDAAPTVVLPPPPDIYPASPSKATQETNAPDTHLATLEFEAVRPVRSGLPSPESVTMTRTHSARPQLSPIAPFQSTPKLRTRMSARKTPDDGTSRPSDPLDPFLVYQPPKRPVADTRGKARQTSPPTSRHKGTIPHQPYPDASRPRTIPRNQILDLPADPAGSSSKRRELPLNDRGPIVKDAIRSLQQGKAECLLCDALLIPKPDREDCSHQMRCASKLLLDTEDAPKVHGLPAGEVWAKQFKSSMKLPCDWTVCFVCVMPLDLILHKNGDDVCKTYEDIIKPVAYAIYCLRFYHPERGHALQAGLLRRLAEADGHIFDNLNNFRRWAQTKHVSGYLNIIELVVAYNQMAQEGLWTLKP